MGLLDRTWYRAPILVRAIVEGMLIQIGGVFSFSLLFQANLEVSPGIPWAAPAGLVLLWLMWRYLDGWGRPSSTSASRHARLRAMMPDRRRMPATLCAGAALGVWIVCQVVFGYRMVEMPAAAGGAFLALAAAPKVTAILLLLTGAIMTGFVEEAAFRGYMQVPIEDRHGPTVAIVVVAVLFAAVHFPPFALFPLFVLGALGWGVMARLTGSTLPGMVVHAAVDAGFFLWVLRNPTGFEKFLNYSAPRDGFDSITIIAGVGVVVAGAVLVAAFLWLARVDRAVREKPSRSSQQP